MAHVGKLLLTLVVDISITERNSLLGVVVSYLKYSLMCEILGMENFLISRVRNLFLEWISHDHKNQQHYPVVMKLLVGFLDVNIVLDKFIEQVCHPSHLDSYNATFHFQNKSHRSFIFLALS